MSASEPCTSYMLENVCYFIHCKIPDLTLHYQLRSLGTYKTYMYPHLGALVHPVQWLWDIPPCCALVTASPSAYRK